MGDKVSVATGRGRRLSIERPETVYGKEGAIIDRIHLRYNGLAEAPAAVDASALNGARSQVADQMMDEDPY